MKLEEDDIYVQPEVLHGGALKATALAEAASAVTAAS